VRRRLFTILSALSLLLCVATLALWIDSRHRSEGLGWMAQSGRDVLITSMRGQIVFEIVWCNPTYDWIRGGKMWRTSEDDPALLRVGWDITYGEDLIIDRFGFLLAHGTMVCSVPAQDMHASDLFPATSVGIPHWLAALALGLAPVWWTIAHVKTRPRARTRGLVGVVAART